MQNRSLPKPLGLSRIMPHDVVFDSYLSPSERDRRVLEACDWVESKLELFMPLSAPQKACLKRILYSLTRHDAIAAEVAIAELILLEEPMSKERDKFGAVTSEQ